MNSKNENEPNAIGITFSKRLDELMKERGYSDKTLAEKCGWLPNVDTIRNYRRGKNAEGKPPNPTAINLYALACALNVPIDYLVGHAGKKTKNPDITAAEDITGLDVKAIQKIQSMSNGVIPEITKERISRIINSEGFLWLIFHISELIDNKSPSDFVFVHNHIATARAKANGETQYTIDMAKQAITIEEVQTFRAEKALHAIIAEIVKEKEGK